MSSSEHVTWISESAEETYRFGRALGEQLRAGDVIGLTGNLGAGKTVLARGIGAGWGALEPVTSPTFVLIHEHRRPQDREVLYHIDCYRLQGAADAEGIGLDDLLNSDGAAVLEWPENIAYVLPAERLSIALDHLDDTRRLITVAALGHHYQRHLRALAPFWT